MLLQIRNLRLQRCKLLQPLPPRYRVLADAVANRTAIPSPHGPTTWANWLGISQMFVTGRMASLVRCLTMAIPMAAIVSMLLLDMTALMVAEHLHIGQRKYSV